MLANSSGVPKNHIQVQNEKEKLVVVQFPSSIKCEIRHFHVIVLL